MKAALWPPLSLINLGFLFFSKSFWSDWTKAIFQAYTHKSKLTTLTQMHGAYATSRGGWQHVQTSKLLFLKIRKFRIKYAE